MMGQNATNIVLEFAEPFVISPAIAKCNFSCHSKSRTAKKNYNNLIISTAIAKREEQKTTL
jgi:hypothetical protein